MAPEKSHNSILIAEHNKVVIAILGLLFSSPTFSGLVLVAISLFDVSSNLGTRIFIGLLGLFSIVCFGWLGGWYLTSLFRGDPALLLSEDGIYDNTEPWSLGLIKWSEIGYIYKGDPFYFWKIVVLQVHDRKAIVKRQRNPLKRFLYKKGMFFKSETEINIRINTITEPVLRELLQRVKDTEQEKLQLLGDSET